MTTVYNTSAGIGSTTITTLGTITTGIWNGTVIGPTYGGTGVNNGASTITIGGNTAFSGAFTFTGTLTGNTSVTFPTSGTLATTATANVISVTGDSSTILATPTTGNVVVSILSTYVGQTSITTLGTIGTGTWHGSVISPTYGGTGLSNPTTHGILIGEGSSNVTPIVLSAGQILIGTTASDPAAAAINSGNGILVANATGSITVNIANNPTIPGAAGMTIPAGNTAARAGSAGTMRFNSQTTVFEGTVDGATWATFETSAIGVTSVTGTSNQIDVSPTTGAVVVSIDAAYVGQTSITTLGTIATGTWAATNIALNHGGTNAALTASNGGIFYSTASAGAILAGTATANQVLLSGSSTTPAWSTATYPATTTINQLLYSSSANTVTGLATATTAVLTTSSGVPTWASELSLALGGTNANLTANNGGIFYSTASAGAILSGTATAQQLLMSGASTTPQWSTTTYPTTNAINTLLYASSANVMAALATANSSVLTTSSGGIPTWSAALSSAIGGTQVENSSGSLIALGLSDSGSANAYAVSITPAPAAYAVGQTISFIAANANTGASTIAINALGTKAITKNGATALASGDIVANQVCTVIYDGTQFQLENPVSTASSGTVTSVATGTGLRGGTITTTGTVNLATQNAMSHRLTLTSATPVTTTDVTAATTLYLTPYKGTDIDIYSGSVWTRFQQAELSITTSGLSASTVYDVFIQYNSGTPQLSLTAWTNATTRATALAYQNGVLVLSGTATSRYVGTVATDGSTKFNDTNTLRGVWNYYNRTLKQLIRQESTATWTYNSSTIRQANGSTSNQVNFIIGVVEDVVNMTVTGMAGASLTYVMWNGIGLDSTTAVATSSNSAQNLVAIASTTSTPLISTFNSYVPVGYHFLSWLEANLNNAATGTFVGVSAPSQLGMSGFLLG